MQRVRVYTNEKISQYKSVAYNRRQILCKVCAIGVSHVE